METTDDRIKGKRTFRNPMLIIGAVMTIFYLGFGSTLLWLPHLLPDINPDIRKVFASMLLVYGIYRGWRIYADYYR